MTSSPSSPSSTPPPSATSPPSQNASSTPTTTPLPETNKGATPPKRPPQPLRPIPSYLQPLRYMGIPPSVLRWKPRLPSRNWSAFLLTVSTLSYLYYDDRRQCRLIRAEYEEKVRPLAEQPMKPNQWPRKVHVYGAKTPGDDDHDQSFRYFKRYVKPILVAAAIDWEVTNGVKQGGLARRIEDDIQQRRRKLLGLEPWKESDPNLPASPFSLSPQQELERELEGGVILLGRPAFKEWAWGMKKGWGTRLRLEKRDRDQELASVLAEDGAFDEVEEEGGEEKEKGFGASGFAGQEEEEEDGAGAPLTSSKFGKGFGFGGSPLSNASSSIQGGGGGGIVSSMFGRGDKLGGGGGEQERDAKLPAGMDARMLEPPSSIPAQPPLCFVDFTNLVGWRNIPRRMVRFFNRRQDVRSGAELGLAIAFGTKETAREFQVSEDVPSSPPQGGDLDWGLESEAFYPPWVSKQREEIEKSRKRYYEDLKTRLKDTRDLTRGLREPSRLEKNDMPKTESELREERFRREKEWRGDEMGHEIVKPEAAVEWDPRWKGSLRVFVEHVEPNSPN